MRKLLLVGAGEAHIYILKQLQKSGLSDVEITLLTPSRYQYNSKMVAGYAEELYSKDAIRIDVQKQAKNAGVEWKKGAAMSVDPVQKVILTDEGALLSYDIVSFNIGTLTGETDLPGVLEHAMVAKPNYRMPDVVEHALTANQLVVVGGDAMSVEMALSLHVRRVKQDPNASTVLISKEGVVKEKGKNTVDKLEGLFQERKIDVLNNISVKKVMKDKLVTNSDQIIGFDVLLWVAGPKSQQLFAAAGILPVDDQGYLLVEDTLQVKTYPSIFAVGGCASLSAHPDIDTSQLHTDRQAPVLWENIIGFLSDGEGVIYHPSPSKRSIMATGNKTALCTYKGKAWHGKWAWKLKDHLDQRFMKRNQ